MCGARCAVARPTRLQTVYARRRRLRLRLRLRRRLDDDLACPSPPRASHGRSRRSVVLVCPLVAAVRSRANSRFSAIFRLRHCHKFFIYLFFLVFRLFITRLILPSDRLGPNRRRSCACWARSSVFTVFFLVSGTKDIRYLPVLRYIPGTRRQSSISPDTRKERPSVVVIVLVFAKYHLQCKSP